jgi:hypothetical protein
LRGHKFTLLIMLFAANGPLVNSLRAGNTTHIVGLLLVASLILICAGRPFLAGVLVGFCALVKLPLMLFCAYYVFQRRWRLAAGTALAIAALVLLSLLIFGTDINIGWYDKCVAPYLSGVVGAFNVQSIDAFLLRLGTGETLLWDWEPVEVSLAHCIGRYLIVGSMLVSRPISDVARQPPQRALSRKGHERGRARVRPGAQSRVGGEPAFVGALLPASAGAGRPSDGRAAALLAIDQRAGLSMAASCSPRCRSQFPTSARARLAPWRHEVPFLFGCSAACRCWLRAAWLDLSRERS